MHDVRADGAEAPRLCIVGDKGRSVLTRGMPESVDFVADQATKQAVTFATASAIAEEVLKTDSAASRIVFNRFKSAIAFQPTVATVPSPETIESKPELVEKFDEYELEGPDRSEFLTDLQEFNLASTIYWGMLENGCSEQASRVQAMENSSKNAERCSPRSPASTTRPARPELPPSSSKLSREPSPWRDRRTCVTSNKNIKRIAFLFGF